MQNYTRTHLYIFPNTALKESRVAFEELRTIIDKAIYGARDDLYEILDLPSSEEDVLIDRDSLSDNLSYIELGIFSKNCFPEYNLTEALLDGFPISMYLAYSEADESLLDTPFTEDEKHNRYNHRRNNTRGHRSGIYRSILLGIDLDTEDFIWNTRQKKYTGDRDEVSWMFPLTPTLKHEVFAEAWENSSFPEGNIPDNFHNQLNLDESGIKDENGFPIFFPSWIESRFNITR